MSVQGTVAIKQSNWNVAITTTGNELLSGLSGVQSMPANTGMLFDMGSPQSSIGINMSQMLFPLDIVFIGQDNMVKGIARNVQPGQSFTFTSDGARYFMEVNATEAANVNAGDTVVITGLPEQNGTAINIYEMMTLMVVLMVMTMMMGAI